MDNDQKMWNALLFIPEQLLMAQYLSGTSQISDLEDKYLTTLPTRLQSTVCKKLLQTN
jgi:hypothetical protein